MNVSAADRHAAQRSRCSSSYLEIGFNYRMTDIQAAVGLVQLGRLDGMVRTAAASWPPATSELLADMPGLRAVRDPPYGRSQLPVVLGAARRDFPLGRDEVLAELADGGGLGPARHHGRAPGAGVRRTPARAAAGHRAAHRPTR